MVFYMVFYLSLHRHLRGDPVGHVTTPEVPIASFLTIRKECLGKYVSSIRAKLERIYAIVAHDRVLGNPPPSFMYPSQFHNNVFKSKLKQAFLKETNIKKTPPTALLLGWCGSELTSETGKLLIFQVNKT